MPKLITRYGPVDLRSGLASADGQAAIAGLAYFATAAATLLIADGRASGSCPGWASETRAVAPAGLPGAVAAEFGIELTAQDAQTLRHLRLRRSSLG